MRSFETIQCQDALFKLASIQDDKFKVQEVNDNKIKIQAFAELSTWNGLILTNKDKSNNTKTFISQAKYRFHDLRHSCASILYDKQWQLKDIQTWFGHSNIETTGNIYTHITKSRKEILAKDLEHTFSIAI